VGMGVISVPVQVSNANVANSEAVLNSDVC